MAVPTGFEPAISALTGPHVWPLHHGTGRVVVYHRGEGESSLAAFFYDILTAVDRLPMYLPNPNMELLNNGYFDDAI